jgi:hypothetical protein
MGSVTDVLLASGKLWAIRGLPIDINTSGKLRWAASSGMATSSRPVIRLPSVYMQCLLSYRKTCSLTLLFCRLFPTGYGDDIPRKIDLFTHRYIMVVFSKPFLALSQKEIFNDSL